MSSSTLGFTDFRTVSGTDGQSVVCSWDFSSALVDASNAKQIYIYSNDGDNFITTHVVPLLISGTNELTTSFVVGGLILRQDYLFSAEVTVNNGGPNIVYYSETTQSFPSSIPQQPAFELTQPAVDQFQIRLTDLSGNLDPSVNSVFDGYSTLTGVYVIYTISNKMITNYFSNDASNSIYTSYLITDCSAGLYDVVVTTENINGRSPLSNDLSIRITTEPTAPLNLSAVELIAVDPSAAYNVESIYMAWNAPLFEGYPTLEGYRISRTDTTDLSFAVISIDTSSNYASGPSYISGKTYHYTDTTNLSIGHTYTYTICAYALDLSGNQIFSDQSAISNSVKSIIYPTCSLDSAIPSNESVTVTASSDNGGSSNLLYDFSGNNSLIVDQSSNIYTFSSLTNGTSYAFQVNAYTTSTTFGYTSVTYPSEYTPASNATPFSDQAPISAFTSTPLDASGVPLDGRLQLTWVDPSNNTIDASFQIVITYDSSSIIVEQGVQSYLVTGLTNGTTYNFDAEVRVPNSEVPGGYVYSSTVDTSGFPFKNPSPVNSVTLTPNFYDLNYEIVANDYTGSGFNDNGYKCTLTNLTTPGYIAPANVLFNLSSHTYTGSISSTFGVNLDHGAQYELTVASYYTFDSTDFYSTDVSTNNYTLPMGISGSNISASPLDLSGNPDGNVHLSWLLPTGQDSSASSYNIYRTDLTVGGTINIINGVIGLFYTDTSVTVGHEYTYAILSVVNGLVSVDYTPSASVVPFKYPSPVTDITITLTDSSGTSVRVDCSENDTNSGLDASYLIYKYELHSGNYAGTIVETIYTTTTYTDFSGLICGNEYTIRISSGVTQNGDDYYNYLDVNITDKTFYPSAAPTPPTSISVSSPANRQLLVSWTNSVAPNGLNIDGNTIYVYTDPSMTMLYYSITVGTVGTVGTDISSVIIYNLNDFEIYYIGVSELYLDNSLTLPNIESSQITGSGTPLTVPSNPHITASSKNTLGQYETQKGKTVVVTWYTDTYYPGCSSTLTRTITDPSSGSVIDASRVILDSSNIDVSGVNTYIDTSFNGDLNGNVMTYSVSVVYPTYSSNPFVSTNPVSVSAIPYDTPYPTDSLGNRVAPSQCIAISDLSDGLFMNWTATISTNGSPLTVVDVVSTDASGILHVTKWLPSTIASISYSNAYIPGTIASNQVAVLSFTSDILISDVLVIMGNVSGSHLLVSSPTQY
jgi:hypothetical protein